MKLILTSFCFLVAMETKRGGMFDLVLKGSTSLHTVKGLKNLNVSKQNS